MQNTYQQKLADLEANSSNKKVKLEGGKRFKIKNKRIITQSKLLWRFGY